jgi:hypothetical protein
MSHDVSLASPASNPNRSKDTNTYCLSCDNCKVTPEHYKDGVVNHVISVNHKCSKNMFPIDCQDENGNVVAEWCKEFRRRVTIRTDKK